MIRALAVTLIAFAVLAGSVLPAEIAAADGTYTVQDGDSLVALAVKFGVPSNQMLDWVASTVTLNGLADADSLKAGQVLKLPSSSPPGPAGQTTTSASSSRTATQAGAYIVLDGDTLLGIAAKLGVPSGEQLGWVEKVVKLNSLSSAEQLAVGQTIRLTAEPDTRATSVQATSLSASSPVSTTSAGAAGSLTTSGNGVLTGNATSYHDSFTNKMMGCTGAGPYKPTDLAVIAVGPAMYDQFPCGTSIEVCGPKGCLTGVRKDSCPGCSAYHVDLSRAGLTAVCGPNSCAVRLRRLP